MSSARFLQLPPERVDQIGRIFARGTLDEARAVLPVALRAWKNNWGPWLRQAREQSDEVELYLLVYDMSEAAGWPQLKYDHFIRCLRSLRTVEAARFVLDLVEKRPPPFRPFDRLPPRVASYYFVVNSCSPAMWVRAGARTTRPDGQAVSIISPLREESARLMLGDGESPDDAGPGSTVIHEAIGSYRCVPPSAAALENVVVILVWFSELTLEQLSRLVRAVYELRPSDPLRTREEVVPFGDASQVSHRYTCWHAAPRSLAVAQLVARTAALRDLLRPLVDRRRLVALQTTFSRSPLRCLPIRALILCLEGVVGPPVFSRTWIPAWYTHKQVEGGRPEAGAERRGAC